MLTFSLRCEIAQLLLNKCHDASAFPFGEGVTDHRSVTDEAANEEGAVTNTMHALRCSR
ncbi:MAG: hypothetical protein IJF67_15450 [Clostridia bacterium]|nr:hypothetical protein [Clostridia bacterium]